LQPSRFDPDSTHLIPSADFLDIGLMVLNSFSWFLIILILPEAAKDESEAEEANQR